MKNRSTLVTILALHVLLGVYSLGGVFSKTAANSPFLSIAFISCYAVVLALLGVYAIGWQQIIKRMPLSTAFANKAITVVWGIFWGIVFFGETLTVGKVIGAGLIVAGIVVLALAERNDKNAEVSSVE